VWVCNTALTSCISSNGDGTFSNSQQLIGGPGYAGLVVEGGYLYAPLTSTGPVPAIAVCGAPQSASSCVLSALEPPISFTGGQNIIVLPAGVTG
jgi:hypothetical protein